jgi:3-phenylpropionate/trans-cinnamate dioxygenase ferredoxin reductase component
MDDEQARPLVIVGGGLAAGRAASTLRKEGFGGHLVVVAAEDHEPYERPPLSKDYLRGETPAEKLLAAGPDLWSGAETELVRGRRATSIDVEGRRVLLDDGRWVPYERLLLATGSSPIRPEMPGSNLDFVHIIRTIDDSDRLRAAASNAGSVAVAGGGWIAAEVAASLRQLGHDVTLVIPGREVLERHLGKEVGATYSALHERNGVHLVRGSRVVEVVAGSAGRGLLLSDGNRVRADLVVLGFGATPNVELAQSAGLAVADGIVTDQELHASAPGIFAAGDVAAAWHPRYGRNLRVEHWDNARQQGRVAALNMLGRPTPYDRLPYFYSDQFDLSMEAFGLPGDAGEVVVRRGGGDQFAALWVAGGRAAAGVQGNDADDSKALKRLVTEQLEVDVERFSDAAVPMSDLLPTEQRA